MESMITGYANTIWVMWSWFIISFNYSLKKIMKEDPYYLIIFHFFFLCAFRGQNCSFRLLLIWWLGCLVDANQCAPMYRIRGAFIGLTWTLVGPCPRAASFLHGWRKLVLEFFYFPPGSNAKRTWQRYEASVLWNLSFWGQMMVNNLVAAIEWRYLSIHAQSNNLIWNLLPSVY